MVFCFIYRTLRDNGRLSNWIVEIAVAGTRFPSYAASPFAFFRVILDDPAKAKSPLGNAPSGANHSGLGRIV